MANLSVEKLATVIGSAPDLLLSQMKEAGLTHSDLSDEVTDSDKIILLGFGSGQQHDRRQQKLHVLRFTSALRAGELRAACCQSVARPGARAPPTHQASKQWQWRESIPTP